MGIYRYCTCKAFCILYILCTFVLRDVFWKIKGCCYFKHNDEDKSKQNETKTTKENSLTVAEFAWVDKTFVWALVSSLHCWYISVYHRLDRLKHFNTYHSGKSEKDVTALLVHQRIPQAWQAETFQHASQREVWERRHCIVGTSVYTTGLTGWNISARITAGSLRKTSLHCWYISVYYRLDRPKHFNTYHSGKPEKDVLIRFRGA